MKLLDQFDMDSKRIEIEIKFIMFIFFFGRTE